MRMLLLALMLAITMALMAACGGHDHAAVAGIPCGTTICGENQFCCNASCGICAPQGGACTQQICDAGSR